MNGSVIAVDVDSVIFPVNEDHVLPALQLWKPEIRLADITTFDYGESLGPVAKKIAMEVFNRPDLYDNQKPSLVVADGLGILRATYDRVIAVTSPFARHASSKWAYLLRAGFAHEDIVLCGDKSLVYFDVLVDDRAETALELGPEEVVIFDRPWNRSAPLDFERAYGWEDVPRKVARLVG